MKEITMTLTIEDRITIDDVLALYGYLGDHGKVSTQLRKGGHILVNILRVI